MTFGLVGLVSSPLALVRLVARLSLLDLIGIGTADLGGGIGQVITVARLSQRECLAVWVFCAGQIPERLWVWRARKFEDVRARKCPVSAVSVKCENRSNFNGNAPPAL